MKIGRGKRVPDAAPGRRRQSASNSERTRQTDVESSNRYAFRRNRTLTGSSSAKVASTNELNAELKSPRAHVHHLTSLRRRLLLYLACVGLVSFGLYLLVSQIVATTTVAVSGTGAVSSADTSAYKNAFDSYYAARPVERLRFMLDERAFASHVQAVRPEVRSIRIETGSSPGEASMVVSARQPIARWSIGGGDQYVDGEGVVFSRNYFDDPSLQIVDNSGLQTDSNRLVASNRFLGFVGRVIAKSQSQQLSVTKVTIPAFTTRQVSVSIAGQSTEYKLSVDRSAGEQVEDMARITRYLAAQNVKPEYVDVRISGKAFYK